MTTEILGATDHHHENPASKVIFGFWVYLMTDCILFATLFATYIVLRNGTYGGPGIAQIVNLPYNLTETVWLLVSGLMNGLAFVSFLRGNKLVTSIGLLLAFISGAVFFALQYNELAFLVHSGYSWRESAFLSAFFTLTGTLSLHVLIGLFWMLVLFVQLWLPQSQEMLRTRFVCLGLFWTFVNVIWVFIFTIVYLMGAI